MIYEAIANKELGMWRKNGRERDNIYKIERINEGNRQTNKQTTKEGTKIVTNSSFFSDHKERKITYTIIPRTNIAFNK